MEKESLRPYAVVIVLMAMTSLALAYTVDVNTTNEAGVLDVFVIWEPEEIGLPEGTSLQYSSSLSWDSATPDARLKEWMGNFLFSPPGATMITDTDNSSPPELTQTDTSTMVDVGSP